MICTGVSFWNDKNQHWLIILAKGLGGRQQLVSCPMNNLKNSALVFVFLFALDHIQKNMG